MIGMQHVWRSFPDRQHKSDVFAVHSPASTHCMCNGHKAAAQPMLRAVRPQSRLGTAGSCCCHGGQPCYLGPRSAAQLQLPLHKLVKPLHIHESLIRFFLFPLLHNSAKQTQGAQLGWLKSSVTVSASYSLATLTVIPHSCRATANDQLAHSFKMTSRPKMHRFDASVKCLKSASESFD